MNEVTIDFTKSPVEISSMILGKQGEHNATRLIITPPAEMTENDDINRYAVVFQVGAYKKFSILVMEKTETISVLLERDATQVNYLSIQLEAYDGAENLLVKSEKLDGFILLPSVIGDESQVRLSSGTVEQVTANTAFRNKFGEDESGNLLYKGESISTTERPFVTISGITSEYFLPSQQVGGGVSLHLTDAIYENHTIKNLWFVIDGVKIDVKNLSALDGKPYIINMDKLIMSPSIGMIHVVTLNDLGSGSNFISNLANWVDYEFELEIYL